jgi:hypothetical protein
MTIEKLDEKIRDYFERLELEAEAKAKDHKSAQERFRDGAKWAAHNPSPLTLYDIDIQWRIRLRNKIVKEKLSLEDVLKLLHI